MPVYFIAGHGPLLFPEGTTLADAQAQYGSGPAAQAAQQDTGPQSSAGGAAGRGAIRGAAPAVGGLAGAITGGETLGAIGGGIGGPPGALIGGVVGALGGGFIGGEGVSRLQQSFFDSHPDVARALGQSREQQQADYAEHPYATAAGQFAPNLLAFRPSLSTFSNVGRAEAAATEGALGRGASEEAAQLAGKAERSRIVGQRVNAAAGAGLGAGLEYGNQLYNNPDDMDYGQVALQGALGLLGQRETRIGAKFSALGRVVPGYDARHPRAPIDDGQPHNIMERAAEDNTAYGADGKQLQIEHQPRVINVDSQGNAAYGDTYKGALERAASIEAERAQKLANFEQTPEGTQSEMFPPETLGQAPEDAARPPAPLATDPVAAPQGGPDMLTDTPSALTRSAFGPKEIMQRLIQETGDINTRTGDKGQANTTPMDARVPTDAFTYKVFAALSKNLATENLYAIRGFLQEARATNEAAPIKSSEQRAKVLDAAERIVNDYETQRNTAMADTGMSRAQPGVDVGEPAPGPESTVAQMQERNKAAEPDVRKQLFEKASTATDVADPVNYFEALLKREGLDPRASDQEFEDLYRQTEQRKTDDTEDMRRAADNGTASLEREIPSARKKDVARALSEKAAPEPTPAPAQPKKDLAAETQQTPEPVDRANAPVAQAVSRARDVAALREAAAPAPAPAPAAPPKPRNVSEQIKARVQETGKAAKPEPKPAPKDTPSDKAKFYASVEAHPTDPDRRIIKIHRNDGNGSEHKVVKEVDVPRKNADGSPDAKRKARKYFELDKVVKEHQDAVERAKERSENPTVSADKNTSPEQQVEALAKARAKAGNETDVRYVKDDAEPYHLYETQKDGADRLVAKFDNIDDLRDMAELHDGMTALEAERRNDPRMDDSDKFYQKLGNAVDHYLGKNDRAGARYAELRDMLAERAPPEKIIEKLKAAMAGDLETARPAREFQPVNGDRGQPLHKEMNEDIPRLQLLEKRRADTAKRLLKELKSLADGQEITASEYIRMRKLLEDGNFKQFLSALPGRAADDPAFSRALVDAATAQAHDIIRETGSGKAVLEHIAQMPGFVGEAAARLAKITDDVPIFVGTNDMMNKRHYRGGEPKPGVKLGGLYSRVQHRVFINGEAGNLATIVHELAHAATARQIEAGTPAGKEMSAIFDMFKSAASPAELQAYGFTNAKEFVAEVWANKRFREAMQDKHLTLWDKVVNAFRRMLGMPPRNFVEKILNLSEESAANPPTKPPTSGFDALEISAKPEQVKKNVDEQPVPLREASTAAASALGQKTKRGMSTMALTHKVVDWADAAGVKSARVWYNAMMAKQARSEHVQEAYVHIAEKFDQLPQKHRGTGPGTLNQMARDMVFKEAWGFQPTWLRDVDNKPISVTVNEKMRSQFDALPKPVQDVMKDAFKLAHETFHQKRQAILDTVEDDFKSQLLENTALLKQAQSKGDVRTEARLVAAREKINKQRVADVANFRKLFASNLTRPYMPVRRYGDYVVTGRSKEYLDAERLARATDEWGPVRAMQSDPKHYFVTFAESEMQAERMRLANESTYAHVEKFTRDKASNSIFQGRDMNFAFQRLSKMLRDSQMGRETQARLQSMISDLQLSVLAEGSARQAEMTFRKINGGDLDMFRGLVSQGQADAHLIGALYKNDEILESLRKMQDEAAFPDGQTRTVGREERQNYVNEILARHAMSVAPPPLNSIVAKATSLTSVWMLMSPSFLIQQLTQNAVMTAPVLAARHGYVETSGALTRGYQRVREAWAGTRFHESLDIAKLSPKDQAFAKFLSERGLLDVGINKTLGSWTSDPAVAGNRHLGAFMQRLNGLTRKTEAINRLSAGFAAYELALKGNNPHAVEAGEYATYRKDFMQMHGGSGPPMTAREFAAANYAQKIILDTHGAYDAMNAPRWMRSNTGKMIGQFRKFQIMQLQLYGQAIKDGFMTDGMSPTEKAVARKALAYMSGHAAIFAGALGVPGAALLKEAYNWATTDDNGPGDAERDLREAIGDPGMADLLLHGAPTLAGLNMTNTLGQAGMLSIQPFADTPTDEKSYNAYVTAALGPAVGGIGLNMARGLNLAQNGYMYKGLEAAMPKAISAPMRAYREYTDGETTRNDDVTDPSISGQEAGITALGLTPLDRTKRQFARSQVFNEDAFYSSRRAELQRKYDEARDAGDMETAREARTEWRDLRRAARAEGVTLSGSATLRKNRMRKLRREKRTVAGVQYDKSDRRRATGLDQLLFDEDQ